ncbi:MAG: type II TA system antitoxin MqsA family protein [Methylococcaceae bacterium]
MQCFSCGEAELVKDSRDITHVYREKSTIIPNVSGDFCPSCGEAVLDKSESQRISIAMLKFNQQVNSTITLSAFITDIRKKLGLEQREAAEIFGSSVSAFSRYETGKTKPPVTLVKLFKVLDHHPELLSELRMMS